MKRYSTIVIAFALSLFTSFTTSCSCHRASEEYPTVDFATIDDMIESGNFKSAGRLIEALQKVEGLSASDLYELNFEKEKMARIAEEFSLTDDDVIPYIKKYLPDVTEDQLDAYRESGALECKTIDGKRYYFNKAARNLFRLVPECVEAYEKVEGRPTGTTEQFLAGYLPKVIEKATAQQARDNAVTSVATIQKNSFTMPVTMRVHVTMRVMPDALPAGEVVRMWLPYPREREKQQKIEVERIFTGYNSELTDHPLPLADVKGDYIISSPEAMRRSIYFEMISNGKDTLKAGYDLAFTSYNQYFANLEQEIKPYDTDSYIYKTYTAERSRHIRFTPEIKALVKSIVGDEENPYQKIKKIWSWINENITWAGARDYSTIPNIPMYVLKNHHGDCGEVSLLFITMARICGVPAKWQSGWMLHPGNLNLHDWAEVYYEGVGWVPVDQSFGYIVGDSAVAEGLDETTKEQMKYFFSRGLDAFRYIVNDDYGDWAPLYPAKIYPHNDEVDFQMGEVEWRAGNLHTGWKCWMEAEYPADL